MLPIIFINRGAPRSMKMGNIASPWPYDVAVRVAPQSPKQRHVAILHYALRAAAGRIRARLASDWLSP